MNSSSRPLSVIHFLVYFSCLLAIGLFVRDIPAQPPLSSTIHSFQEVINMGDPRFFAWGALDIFRHGWITPENRWLINLWPPGFMMLEGAILRIFGENVPFIAVLLVLSALLQSFWMLVLWRLIRPQVSALVAFLLPLLPFAFPVTRQFLLEPSGLALGEAFALGFFVSFALMMVLAVRSQKFWVAIAGGACLGLCAYFRSQYGTIVTVTSLGALPMLFWLLLRLRLLPQDSPLRFPVRVSLKSLVLAVLAAQAVMLPWRVYAKLELNRTTWVATQETMASGALSPSEAIIEKGGAWIVRGGGNMACIVAPEYCGETDPAYFYRALLEHPVEWVYRKALLLDEYWFASLLTWTEPNKTPRPVDWVANSFLLAFLLAIAPLLLLTRRRPEAALQVWIVGSFFLCFAAIFTLAHFETRYFYLIKIFAVVLTILLGCAAWSQGRERRTSVA